MHKWLPGLFIILSLTIISVQSKEPEVYNYQDDSAQEFLQVPSLQFLGDPHDDEETRIDKDLTADEIVSRKG